MSEQKIRIVVDDVLPTTIDMPDLKSRPWKITNLDSVNRVEMGYKSGDGDMVNVFRLNPGQEMTTRFHERVNLCAIACQGDAALLFTPQRELPSIQ